MKLKNSNRIDMFIDHSIWEIMKIKIIKIETYSIKITGY